MGIMWYLVASVLILFIDVLLVCMLVSAVMSWIAPTNDHRIIAFINGIVDTVVSPVRQLLGRFEFVRSFPLDIPFYLTSVLLVLIRTILSSL